MRRSGWRGDPLEVVQEPDGSEVSIDNRRVVAVRMANAEATAAQEGVPLPEVPIKIYRPEAPFPPSTWTERAKINSFVLRNPIRRSAKAALS